MSREVKISINEMPLDCYIKVMTDADIDQWNSFVESSINGTIFHRVDFLSYHAKGRFQFHHLIFYSKASDEIIAVLPAIKKDNQLISPGGASFGSFIFAKTSLAISESVIRGLIDYASEKSFTSIFLTPAPLFYSKDLSQNVDYLLFYYGAQIEKNLVTNALSLDLISTSSQSEILSEMHIRCVKKSVKEGVTCKITDENSDYEEFYKMLVENKKKFNQPATHSLAEILWIKEKFKNKVFLFMAYDRNQRPIGSIWALRCNENCLLAFYINHYYEFRELRAVNRLYQELIDFAVSKNIKWIDLGVSMDTSKTNPMEPSRSLIYFKECIGTRGFLRTTYRIDL